MRGEACSLTHLSNSVGITPACAGRSATVRYRAENTTDHPRVCGEKALLLQAGRFYIGSPPRVRGEEAEKNEMPVAEGITPACAGRRGGEQMPSMNYRDHPRVCGEKSALRYLYLPKEGSPPRVRGEVLRLIDAGRDLRITPACAGRSTPTSDLQCCI